MQQNMKYLLLDPIFKKIEHILFYQISLTKNTQSNF